MLERIVDYFSYSFVIYAFVVGILIALCSSLIGSTLILKRYSFIGDGLSHVAFGAMAVATLFNLTNNIYIVMPITIVAAILLLKRGQNAAIKGDAAIAMISVGALAVGYLLLNIFNTSANVSGDVCSTLFGSASMLTLTLPKVITCIILSCLVIATFFVFYHKIFAVTFDENFAKATGVKADAYNFIIAIIIAVIIVMGMNLVGSLLISALIIFPSLTAMQLVKNFKSVVLISGMFSIICAALGMLLSIAFSTPVGATIVVCNIVLFVFCDILGKIRRR